MKPYKTNIYMKTYLAILLILVTVFSCTQKTDKRDKLTFKQQLEDYFQKFPYQDSYNYVLKYTGGGNAALLNKLFPNTKPVLENAGSDRVVRMNNDTYYTGGVIYLSEGPVKLSASEKDENRFYSFQLMDDRNVNFKNIIRPDGDYYLYYGEKPTNIEGELIESSSMMAIVIIRVEVKDKNDSIDIASAKRVFNGINISGPEISEFPVVDVLSSFDEKVVKRANEMMDSVFANVPFYKMAPSPEQIPDEVSYLRLAAGTKGAWGAPVAAHSTYQLMFFDNNNDALDGSKGTYTLTTKVPPVDAFWSITVYDTERGGFLHPNKDDRYHINNTSAIKNNDGTITFLFKTHCQDGDVNCLEVPTGKFDLAARYYLPSKKLQNGEWKMPNPKLVNE